MNDPDEGSKVLKVVLIVALATVGLAALCCGGLYLTGTRVVEELQQAMGPTVRGSGVPAVQERLVVGFEEIRVEGVIDVHVTIGDVTSVKLQADDNILPLVTTEVVDGTLTFASRQAYDAESDMRATVVVPTLRSVTVEGVGDVTVRGLDQGAFSVTLLGVGGITAEGRVDTLDVEVRGIGDASLAKLVARTVTARVHGIGDAEVHATESLVATVTGMGDVIYHGDPPTVRPTVEGMGSVVPAE